MAATTGYQAGVETNATQISYSPETAWGVAPAVQFQAIRYTSESMALTKTRQRPNEIQSTREASQAVTTQQQAGGTINYAFSSTTYDDFMASLVGNDWQTAQVIGAITTDIVFTATGTAPNVTNLTLTSTLSTKFQNLTALSWIRIFGATNAANNGWWFISVKTNNQTMTLTGPNRNTSVTETSAANIQIRASTIKNSTLFKSVFLQQQLSASQFLTYPGAYPSRMTLGGGIGNFMSGAIDLFAQNELSSASNSSTGAVLAAPTGRVYDPVAGFVGAFFNETALSASVDQFALTMENTQAAPEFALGSAAAAGMLGGTFQASGSFRAYFKLFTEYTNFVNETSGRMSFIIKDFTGYSYAFTFLNAVLLGKIESGGPGQPVYASFDVEGGPSATGAGTLIIDRLANT